MDQSSVCLYAPKELSADLQLPASKSISNRVLLIQALAGCHAGIHHLSDCEDTQVLARALKDRPEQIDIKGAGTAMRFLTAFLSVTPEEHILTGNGRMQERPVEALVNALNSLGADIRYLGKTGFPPLLIRGRQLTGGKVCIAGDISSQYISALLMIAPCLHNGLELELTGKVLSRPYIDMTLSLMKKSGADAGWTDGHTLKVKEGKYRPISCQIESDWSAASYWYEIVSLWPHAQVFLRGLEQDSCQGDSVTAALFEQLGVSTEYLPQGVLLRNKPGLPLPRMEADFSPIPDLAQTFCVTCCLKGIPFRFCGLDSLYIKETDRIAALRTELAKLGYITEEPRHGVLAWNSQKKEVTGPLLIDTYNDHRMAMAFAPAARFFNSLHISHPEVVSKSYPDFWSHLQQAGFLLEK